ncbi:MAG: sigma-70 family RNA polymerase sigma factor [Proteobacteria bacterium]|nr:sigma-70 family RNA polymerase sigma factor [Pseudomonadota bacterium]MBU1057179.1 sigma-70 family RNA polymerase sigma factor [Pseudomonadota bacterium]
MQHTYEEKQDKCPNNMIRRSLSQAMENKQPPSLVEQELQSTRLLSHEEEIRHTKTIRENFHTIILGIRAIQSPCQEILTLQNLLQTWEKKDSPIKPGKRRLDHTITTLESAAKKRPQDHALVSLLTQHKALAKEIETAKDILITTNIRLVSSIAKRYTDRGLSLADLTQEGCIGLMRAVFRFDHNTGRRFSTYASWWIRQAITRAIPEKTRTIKLPAHFLVSCNHFNKSFTSLHQRLGRRPTIGELSQTTYMPYNKMLSIMETSREPVSLEEPVGDNAQTLIHVIADHNSCSPADNAITADLSRQIEGILATLNAREAQVIRLRFGIGVSCECTLDEVGKKFNVSRERIRQIEQEALQRLRHPNRSDHIRCFLESN